MPGKSTTSGAERASRSHPRGSRGRACQSGCDKRPDPVPVLPERSRLQGVSTRVPPGTDLPDLRRVSLEVQDVQRMHVAAQASKVDREANGICGVKQQGPG